jgi:hypothetical protein
MVDAAHHADLDPDRISHKNAVRIIRSRIWAPESFPLTDHDDRYRCLLREIANEINPPRRDRSYPRVIKRKMSNFPVKGPTIDRGTATAGHRTPQSRSAHRPRPDTNRDQLEHST